MGVIKRSKSKESKHVRLYRYETESMAYKALSGDAVKVLIEIHMRYNGKNNGRIGMGSRCAGKAISKSHSAGARKLRELRAYKFITLTKDSTFAQKNYSREYALTSWPLKEKMQATKDFMKLSSKDIECIKLELKTKHSNTDDRLGITGDKV